MNSSIILILYEMFGYQKVKNVLSEWLCFVWKMFLVCFFFQWNITRWLRSIVTNLPAQLCSAAVSVCYDDRVNGFHNRFDVRTIYRPDRFELQCCTKKKMLPKFVRPAKKRVFWKAKVHLYLKSEANRFFGMAGIRSVVVRKLELLDVCRSSSAEKNASDGFSDVSDIVRWTWNRDNGYEMVVHLNNGSIIRNLSCYFFFWHYLWTQRGLWIGFQWMRLRGWMRHFFRQLQLKSKYCQLWMFERKVYTKKNWYRMFASLEIINSQLWIRRAGFRCRNS